MTGKYDDIAERVFHETGAELVSIMVINGKRGSGISVTALDGAAMDEERRAKTAQALRVTADMLENMGTKPN